MFTPPLDDDEQNTPFMIDEPLPQPTANWREEVPSDEHAILLLAFGGKLEAQQRLIVRLVGIADRLAKENAEYKKRLPVE